MMACLEPAFRKDLRNHANENWMQLDLMYFNLIESIKAELFVLGGEQPVLLMETALMSDEE